MLRQPIDDLLQSCQRILLAGAGGGYDVLGAVPLQQELLASGKEVHLASLSFCRLGELEGAERHADYPNLYQVHSEMIEDVSLIIEGNRYEMDIRSRSSIPI